MELYTAIFMVDGDIVFHTINPGANDVTSVAAMLGATAFSAYVFSDLGDDYPFGNGVNGCC